MLNQRLIKFCNDNFKDGKLILEKLNEYKKILISENERMNFQVENVLRISQLERSDNILKKKKCDIHDLINKALSHLDLLIKNRNVKIVTNFNALQSDVFVSMESFINVFVNVIENAIKYSGNDPVIKISSINQKNNLEISVSDNGIGMSTAVKEKIFFKFYREKMGNIHDVKGHGLGLAYVKKIIDLHNAKILVESDLGIGSTFKLHLKLYDYE